MAIHLFIIGKKQPFLTPFKMALERAKEVRKEFYVRTCSARHELINVVREVVLLTGQRVDMLDIFDHGREGLQELAGEVLFAASDPPNPDAPLHIGKDMADGLSHFLTHDARVRLLGCKTAVGAPGQALLVSLQRELGRANVVFGTTDYADAIPEPPPDADVDGSEFGARGFRDVKEDNFLFSSTEARERVGPDRKTREKENDEWFEKIKKIKDG